MNTTLFDVQNDVNCISEDLDFKLFWRIMPPAPPPPSRLKGLLRRLFAFFHTTNSAAYRAAAYVASWKTSESPVC